MKILKAMSAAADWLIALEYRIEARLAMADEQLDREMERLHKEDQSLFYRVLDNPVGFCLIFMLGCLAFVGLAEMVCTLLGAPFDPRFG